MKRKLSNILLGIAICLSVTACGVNKANTLETKDNEVIQTESGEVMETGKGEEADSVEEGNILEIEGASYLNLSDNEITINGDAVTTNSEEAVYVANDIVYYEEGKDFTYGEGTKEDAHSQEEAKSHTVVHITEPGTYVLSGKLEAGQIAVDLGEDAKDNPEAVVTLVLNNVDINCSVAPGVIFYNVYECCSSEEENATKDVDTEKAGANVLIADGSTNTVNGSYVARIYESVELNEEGTEIVESEKLHKYDGAFYSKMSMNVNGGEIGDGVLNIYAENEGLDSELHLTINGGQINIVSGNDGINTNEDNVSVTTVNGGILKITVDGSTGEGDGIDSNGWLVINGGVVNASACATSGDAGIDSDKGIHINGGTVIATGNMLDEISESEQTYVIFSFQNKVAGNTQLSLKKGEESLFLSMPNDFSYLIVSHEELTEGTYTLWAEDKQLSVVETDGQKAFGGQKPEGMEKGEGPQMPEGMEKGERPQMPEGMEAGERPQMPEGMEAGEGPGGRGEKEREEISRENAVTEFEIKNGVNRFAVIWE